ncbi:MAG: hypothetical protein WDN46_00400 [Methylocella sp.]
MSIMLPIRSARASAAPMFSLLRLSASTRFGGVLILVAALWASVYWALH